MFVTGSYNIINGNNSSVMGSNNIATGYDQVVMGHYNVEDTENKFALIVGGGAKMVKMLQERIYSNLIGRVDSI